MLTRNEYKRMSEICRRDEQSLWCAQYILDVLGEASELIDWYRNYTAKDMPATPERFISQMLSPGNDGDQKLAHRLLSLARCIHERDPQNNECFVLLQARLDELFKVLNMIYPHNCIHKAITKAEEFFDYLERMEKRKVTDKNFSERVMEHVKALIAAIDVVSDEFKKLETSLISGELQDPDHKILDSKINDNTQQIKSLKHHLRKGMTTPSQRNWVVKQVMYYQQNPHLLTTNIKGRRVRLRDVWFTVEVSARREHHIEDFEIFKRSYETEMRNRRRNS